MGKLSENEAKNLLAQMEKTEDELHQLRKKFNQDVKSVLSAQKLVKLYKAEEQFRKNLLKQLRSNREAIKN
jgi:Spy/CpxP family protein refolding chaperone